MALSMEALDKDQLAAKRGAAVPQHHTHQSRHAGKSSTSKAIQQLNVALTRTEDAMIIAVAVQPEENVRLCWRKVIKLQWRGVSELTELMEKMRIHKMYFAK